MPEILEMAERGLIGAVMLYPDALLKATDIISYDDLTPRHRAIFIACLDLFEDGGDVRLPQIAERLKIKGEIEVAGGVGYLAELAAETFTAANIRHHAKIIKQASLLRKAKRLFLEAYEQTKTANDISEVIPFVAEGINSLAEAITEKKSPHIADILSEINLDWQQSREGREQGVPVRLFDRIDRDAQIPGLYPGHLIVLGGYTSVGKSTFLAQLLVDACLDGAKVCIFSTEDSRKAKVHKLLANVSDVSQKKLITGRIHGFEDRLKEAEDTIKQWGVVLYDDIYSVGEMRLKAKKHKLRGGLDIVAVDFIQNIQGHPKLYERLSDGIVRLQALAKELEVCVIVLSQVSNEAMKEGSDIIGLKGAGELAAAADIVLWLRRFKMEERQTHLDCEIKKNRPFGETGIAPFQFSQFWTRIERRLDGKGN